MLCHMYGFVTCFPTPDPFVNILPIGGGGLAQTRPITFAHLPLGLYLSSLRF